MPMALPCHDDDLTSQWVAAQTLLRQSLGEEVYNKWIRTLRLARLEGNRAEVSAPSRFTRDWIKSHYLQRIQDSLSKVNSHIRWVDIHVDSPSGLDQASASHPYPPGGSFPSPSTTAANGGLHATSLVSSSAPANGKSPHTLATLHETSFQAHLDPQYTFENFVVGKSNELAYAAALRVTDNDQPAFNPLFLYGGVGLGKTHLMHAIAWRLRQNAQNGHRRRVIYLSAEKFMYQFICALRQKDMVSFKEQFRTVDVLMIDDVQFISGKDSTQEEFFHTFNALVDQNKQIILSADKSPSNLDGIEERLKSRLGWGLVADIHPTSYELRLGILQSKVDKMAIHVPHKVLEFLAHKITSNVRELEGALKRIAAHSTLVGSDITLDLTQETLKDLLRSNDRRVTLEDIKKKVAERYGVKVSELEGARRQRTIVRPRQIAMYLCKILTSKSLPEIGRVFGGRDHTTIIHAVKTIERLSNEDVSLAEDVEILSRSLGA